MQRTLAAFFLLCLLDSKWQGVCGQQTASCKVEITFGNSVLLDCSGEVLVGYRDELDVKGRHKSDPSVNLGASLVALHAPNDLTVRLSLSSDVAIKCGDSGGSSWILHAQASRKLEVASIIASDATITGGGLLRAVAPDLDLRNVNLQRLVVIRGCNSSAVNLPTDAVIQLQPTTGPTNLTVGSPKWLAAANMDLLQSELVNSRAHIAHLAIINFTAKSMASVIGASGFVGVDVQHVDARGLNITGLQEYNLAENSDKCWTTKSQVCAGLDGDQLVACEQQECKWFFCQLHVARQNPGGVVRLQRDFGRGRTFEQCVQSEKQQCLQSCPQQCLDQCLSSDDGQGLDTTLLPSSWAVVANVTIGSSSKANTIDYFTTHLVIKDYPRVNVSDSKVDDATVDGLEQGNGLLITTPVPKNDTSHPPLLPFGSQQEYTAFLRPSGQQRPLESGEEFRDSGSYVFLTNTSFARLSNPDGNRWSGYGGAAYLGGFEYGEVAGVVVDGMRVGRHGGGVVFDGVAYVWTRDSVFENVLHGHPTDPSDSFGGGLLILQATEVLVSDCKFRNLTGANLENEWRSGSALSLRASAQPKRTKRARLERCLVENCHSRAQVVNLEYTEDVQVLESDFFGNSAKVYDSILFFTASQQVLVEGCSFVSNSIDAGSGGVLVFNSVDRVLISNSFFRNNVANSDTQGEIGGNGGAVNILSAGIQARIEGCTFVNNTASKYGGAVSVVQTCMFSVANSTFTGNFAAAGGGAISATVLTYWDCPSQQDDKLLRYSGTDQKSVWSLPEMKVIVDNRRIGDKQWGKKTGSNLPLLDNTAGQVALDNCKFVDNSARASGGAVLWEFQTASSGHRVVQVVRNSSFRGNKALHGGALRMFKAYGGVILQNVVAAGNVAKNPETKEAGNGGLLAFAEPAKGSVVLAVRGLTAWDNEASFGGVIYADSGSVLLVSGMVAYNNKANVGGAIACSQCDLVGTQLDSTRAVACQMENQVGLPSMSHSTVSYSAVDGQDANLRDLLQKYKGQHRSVFFGNTAQAQGGALYCENCGALVLLDATMQNNAAQQGGAVCTINLDSGLQLDVPGLLFVVDGVTLTDNSALQESNGLRPIVGLRPGLGGGIYSNAALFLLKGLDSQNNLAAKGGSVFWRAASGQLSGALTNPGTGVLVGSQTALMRIAQCPNIVGTSINSLMEQYKKFNPTYASNMPKALDQCFQEQVPEPACDFGFHADPVKRGTLARYPLTDWTFYLNYGCSNSIEQILAIASGKLYQSDCDLDNEMKWAGNGEADEGGQLVWNPNLPFLYVGNGFLSKFENNGKESEPITPGSYLFVEHVTYVSARVLVCSDDNCHNSAPSQTQICPEKGYCAKGLLAHELFSGNLVGKAKKLDNLGQMFPRFAVDNRLVAMDGYTCHPGNGSDVAALDIATDDGSSKNSIVLLLPLKRSDEALNVMLYVRDGLGQPATERQTLLLQPMQGATLVGETRVRSSNTQFDLRELRVRGTFGAHFIEAKIADDVQRVPMKLMSLLRRCYWGEKEVPLDSSSPERLCARCSSDSISLDKTKCELCPPNANCAINDTAGSPAKLVLLPNDMFWHSSAASSKIIQCRSPKSCKWEDGKRTRSRELRECQEKSWQLLNELESYADATRDVLAASDLDSVVQEAVVKELNIRIEHVLAESVGSALSYCSLFPTEDTGEELIGKCNNATKGNFEVLLDNVVNARPGECSEVRQRKIAELQERKGQLTSEDDLEVQRAMEDCVFHMLEVAIESFVGCSNLQEYTNLQCSEGYKGPLCGACSSEPDDKKWGLRQPFLCQKCGQRQIVVYLMSIVGFSVLLSGATLINLANNRAGYQAHYYISDVGKVLLSYVQQIGILGGVNVDIPQFFQDVTDTFQRTYDPANGTFCLYNARSSWLPATQTILLRLLSPYLTLLLLIAVWLTISRIRRGSLSYQRRNALMQLPPLEARPYGLPGQGNTVSNSSAIGSPMQRLAKPDSHVGQEGGPTGSDASVQSTSTHPQQAKVGWQGALATVGEGSSSVSGPAAISQSTLPSSAHALKQTYAGMGTITPSSREQLPGSPQQAQAAPAGQAAASSPQRPLSLRDQLKVLVLTAILFFYPNVAQSVLSIFTCYKVDNKWWWAYQMDRRCFQGQHRTMFLSVGLIGLIFWVISPPVWLFLVLYRLRGTKLRQEKTQAVYLFLYHSYREKFHWWEALKMTYILGLVCVRVLGVRLQDPERLGVFLAILLGFMLLVLTVRPYRFKTVHNLETTGLFLVISATYLLQFALLNTEGAFSKDSTAFRAVLIITLVLFVIFGLVLVWYICKSAWINNASKLSGIASTIRTVASKGVARMKSPQSGLPSGGVPVT